MKLYYSHNLNPRVAVAAAKHLGSPVEFVRASPQHPDNIAAFRAINPNALVPVLVEDDGRTTWETDAVAFRLSQIAGSDFWRTGPDAVEMTQWLSWSAYHLGSAAAPLYFYRIVFPTFSKEPVNEAMLAEALADFRRHAETLNAHLADRRWALGETVSYADFRLATALPFAEGAGLPVAEFRNIARWHDQLWALEAWREPFKGID
ncbi:glutathione S-transferase family protein [Phenylobacterium sp.]|uniref:glutathione S-transferase family protein n=1 Tax=Phenylobacterium sp. TaxID=1871053 RepID=UPI002F3F62BD